MSIEQCSECRKYLNDDEDGICQSCKDKLSPATPFNLLIAVCSNRDWKSLFGISLCNLMCTLTRKGVPHTLNALLQTSLLPEARQRSITTAMNGGFTHILMLDDDMCFSPDAVLSLIHKAQAETLPFIAANYITKDMGFNCKPCAKGLDGHPLSSVGKSGKDFITEIGLGMALIDVEMMKAIPKPWFEVGSIGEPDQDLYLGEDYYFCRLLGHEAVPLLVDHDASQDVGHIGDFVYNAQNVASYHRVWEFYKTDGGRTPASDK